MYIYDNRKCLIQLKKHLYFIIDLIEFIQQKLIELTSKTLYLHFQDLIIDF